MAVSEENLNLAAHDNRRRITVLLPYTVSLPVGVSRGRARSANIFFLLAAGSTPATPGDLSMTKQEISQEISLLLFREPGSRQTSRTVAEFRNKCREAPRRRRNVF